MSNFNKCVIDCNKAIENASKTLKMAVPDVYYINHTDTRIEMYDKHGSFISEDFRDIRWKVNKIRYIPKEKVIYINTVIFDDNVSMLVKCYQTVRQIYQLQQVYYKIHHMTLSEDKATISAWKWCYSSQSIHPTDHVSPVYGDMMAFATVMMRKFHKININFKSNDYRGYDLALSKIEEKIPYE